MSTSGMSTSGEVSTPPLRPLHPASSAEGTSGRTLVFLHVPKTAGTTLNRIIEAQYNPLRIYSIPGGRRVWSIERFKRLPERRRRRIRVLKGHLEYGLHRYLPQAATYFTMLRDSVGRVVSSYYYGLSSRSHPLHRVLNDQHLTIEQYVELAQWGNNLQSKLIGGVPTAEISPPEALAAARRGEFVPPERFAGTNCTPEILEAAKRNLERGFSVVGLTERFEESLALMIIAYGWRVPYYQRFRETRKRPAQSLAPSTIAFIEERNGFDLELYDFGRKLFDSALERHGEQVERILHGWRAAPRPGALVARLRAGVAWGRFAASLVWSAL